MWLAECRKHWSKFLLEGEGGERGEYNFSREKGVIYYLIYFFEDYYQGLYHSLFGPLH